jgi:hypothetical protein
LQVNSLERHAEALASIESAVDKLAMSSLNTPPHEAALARIASLEEERVQLVASLSAATRQRDNSVAVTSELIRQLQVREYSRPPLEGALTPSPLLQSGPNRRERAVALMQALQHALSGPGQMWEEPPALTQWQVCGTDRRAMARSMRSTRPACYVTCGRWSVPLERNLAWEIHGAVAMAILGRIYIAARRRLPAMRSDLGRSRWRPFVQAV